MAKRIEFGAPRRGLQRDVHVRLWPDDVPADQPRPLLITHDGADYDALARLTKRAGGLMGSGKVRPFRVALVDPAWELRNNWYSCSAAYADALTQSVIPEIKDRIHVEGRIAAIGASLGAISLLHAEYTYPGTFGAMMLQSTSFHHERFISRQEVDYVERGRVEEFVEKLGSTPFAAETMQIGITWNEGPGVPGNKVMSNILSTQGHAMEGGLVAGGHDYESWGNALDPVLGNVLERTWGN